MSNIKIAGFQSNLFEELDDADLMAVVGGGGTDIVGDLAKNVTGTLANSGDSYHPTSSAIGLVGGFVSATGDYTTKNAGGFVEGTLTGTNGTLVDLGKSV